jgi:hypothetical protein
MWREKDGLAFTWIDSQKGKIQDIGHTEKMSVGDFHGSLEIGYVVRNRVHKLEEAFFPLSTYKSIIKTPLLHRSSPFQKIKLKCAKWMPLINQTIIKS